MFGTVRIIALFFAVMIDAAAIGFFVYHLYLHRHWFRAKRVRATLVDYKRKWYGISYQYQLVSDDRIISVWSDMVSDWNFVRRFFTKKFCGHDQTIRVSKNLMTVYASPFCDVFTPLVMLAVGSFSTWAILSAFVL